MRITLTLIQEDYVVSYTPIEEGSYVVTYAELGEQGVPGKSAYQIAKENGYTGTEEEFAVMLISIQDKQDKIEIGNPLVSLLDIYNLGKL